MNEIIIRQATINDIDDMVHLMDQLGYPTTKEKMAARFLTINSMPSYNTLVAEHNGKVVGMVETTFMKEMVHTLEF